MKDQVFSLINEEFKRQNEGIELIASENFVSKEVLEAMGSCLTNKYAEGYPGKRYYGGCEVVDEIEDLARNRAKELFGAEWVNVQPHSGSQANYAVMAALLNPADKILGFDLSHGGHLTHGSSVNFSGRLFETSFYGLSPDSGLVDMDLVRNKAQKNRPKLIIVGASAYSRDWDYKAFREIADEVGAILMADIAHPAGLIAAKLLNNPLPHCDVVTTTTHKTLRGPRGGMILVGKNKGNPVGLKTLKGKLKRMGTILDSSVFPGIQGGPLIHVIAGKAVAFGEALKPSFVDYGKQVIKNAQTMAQSLLEKGYKIISNGTDNHMMLLDLRNKGVTGKDAEEILVKAEITTNKNMVPFDDEKPTITSGIRIGTAAITSRGLKEEEIKFVAKKIDEAIISKGDEAVINRIKMEIKSLMKDFPLNY